MTEKEHKKKYYLLLNRFTNLEFKKEDVKDYLEQCRQFEEKPNSSEFLDYLGCRFYIDSFNEKVDDTEIDDAFDFYKLIKEIEND